jgi:predicted nucleic acid-binding protein
MGSEVDGLLGRHQRPASQGATGRPLLSCSAQRYRNARQQGKGIHITSQNIIECWNVLTRPADRNGFGMSPAQADREVQQLEAFFPLLPDTPAIYKRWCQIVTSVGVSGVQVHDARLVAAMLTHGVTHLLTFNSADFSAIRRLQPCIHRACEGLHAA